MDNNTLKSLLDRIEALELKCRSLDRQNELLIMQLSHNIGIIQKQEIRIAKLELMLLDDYK